MTRRHISIAVVVWVAATILSLIGVSLLNPFPTAGSEEAEIVDGAFFGLSYLAAPVFGMVIAVLAYCVLRFRARGPEEDGEPLLGRGMVPVVWLLVTTALCATVIIWPGLTGLAELRAEEQPDLVLKVSAARWNWTIEYPDGTKVTGKQPLVLPADERVQFDITAVDVLHSFWIPAFRLKIDAVPGQITSVAVTPNREGDAEVDSAYRLQCTELCGLQHANMAMPVKVVPRAEFDAWLQEQQAKATR